MRSLAIASLLVASAAHAEPTQWVAASVMFGAAEPVVDGYNAMAAVDGGYRLTELLWAHAGVAYGTSIDRFGQHVPNGGRNSLVRGGAAARWCAGSAVCGEAGVDLGVQHGTWSGTVYSPTVIGGVTEVDTDTALVAIPRIGLDVGGDTLRARLGLEADAALASSSSGMSTAAHGIVGIELVAGVAYQW
jgi:hypothetical protein